MNTQNPIDPQALDSLSVAPPDPGQPDQAGNRKDASADAAGEEDGEGEGEGKGEGRGQHPRQEAGQDASIAERLARDPSCIEAQLDRGLDESMDASDPPSITQPGKTEPAPSSSYDEAAEEAQRNT